MQVQVREAVLDEQSSVALLEIGANRRIAEVDQLAVEHQLGGCQQVLFTPASGNRRGGQILERRGAKGLGEGSLGLEIGAEIGQNLSQRGLGVSAQ